MRLVGAALTAVVLALAAAPAATEGVIADNGVGAGPIAFLLFLVLVLGGRFLLGGGTVDDPS